jgi:ketosteroid isomerase-like protein
MSQENVEIVQRVFGALQCNDVDEFLRHLDPEVEFRSLVLELEGPVFGHEGAREWWRGLKEVFPDWNPTMLEVRDLGEYVLVHARGQGRGGGSGVGIDDDFWQVAQFRDGRVVRYAAFRTEAEALEAVGLRE